MNTVYRLGVLSDTHIEVFSDAMTLAERLLAGPFARVDAILHAGDLVIPELENCFGEIPFYAVRGNMDAPSQNLPFRRIITLADYRIGLIHGWGAPSVVAKNVQREFDNEMLDLLVFGHSHIPFCDLCGDTLLFNPGSATQHRGRADGCTVGLISLGPKLKARHIPFEVSFEV